MSWNKNFPALTDQVDLTFTNYHNNWDAIEDTFATDHRYMGQADEGEHIQISYTAPITTPSAQDGKFYSYIKDYATTESPYAEVIEQTFLDGENNEMQVTSGGRLMPKTVFIDWDGSSATTFPSSGVTVTKTGTGVYDLTFPEIGGSFLFFNFIGVGTLSFSTITEQTATTATLKTYQANGNATDSDFRLEIKAVT